MTVTVFKLESFPSINQTKTSDWSKIPFQEICKMAQLQSRWERGMKTAKTPLGKINREIKSITAFRNENE